MLNWMVHGIRFHLRSDDQLHFPDRKNPRPGDVEEMISAGRLMIVISWETSEKIMFLVEDGAPEICLLVCKPL